MTTATSKNNQLSNNTLQVFKPDNSKLIQLASDMISQGQVKTSLEFAEKFMFTFDSEDQFPINITTLIEMKVYKRKGDAKAKLIKNFDYTITNLASVTTEARNSKAMQAGLNMEIIMLTIDCFKTMCMIVRNETGKQIQRYYLDLEKIFKQYIINEISDKQQIIKHKQNTIEHISNENFKLQKKHNNLIKTHFYYKFKKSGPAFYIIVSGLEYKDCISRVKIGICGCKKRKIKSCPHCKEVLEENKDHNSIDSRLGDHRTLWPRLKVKFVVYTPDAKLLEKCMKRLYTTSINPNGHEIIEGVSVSDIIDKTKEYLDMFNIYNTDSEYLIEENIEEYNKHSLTIIKDVQGTSGACYTSDESDSDDMFVIEEDEQEENVEEEIDTFNELLTNIDKYTDKRLKELLKEHDLVQSGLKAVKKTRMKNYLLKKLNKLTRTCNTCKETKLLDIKYYREFGKGFKKRCLNCDIISCKTTVGVRKNVKTKITKDTITATCSRCLKTITITYF